MSTDILGNDLRNRDLCISRTGVVDTAILDRLLHHPVTLNIRGNSYRVISLEARRPADVPATGSVRVAVSVKEVLRVAQGARLANCTGALQPISALYAVEAQIGGRLPAQRVGVRQARAWRGQLLRKMTKDRTGKAR